MIAVRRADPGDAAAISALNDEVQAIHAAAVPWRFRAPGPDTCPPSEVTRLLAAPGIAVFLAEVDGTPAGYVLAEIQRRPETPRMHAHAMVYVHHIGVGAALRRQGVGRALLDAAVGLARAEGIDRISLDTWTFNTAAREFFLRYGLEPYNERLWMRLP